MYYTDKPKSETNDESAIEVKETAVAYYSGRAGNAAAEPYGADSNGNWDNDDFGAPESVTVHSYEELCQKLEEGMADVRAGRVRPFKEAMRDFWRDVQNDNLFEELEKAEANRRAGAKTYSISEVSERLQEIINGRN